MANSGFFCSDGYLARLAKLSDQEVGRLFRACMIYHATGEVTELAGRESIAFDFIREDIDAANKKYTAKCEKNQENIKKRWAGTNEYDRIRPYTNEENDIPNDTNEYKVKVKVNKKVNVKENDKENVEPQKRFHPPTREELTDFCREQGISVDVDRFLDYYTSNGWKVGKNPMKDWRATARNWARDSKGASPGKTVTAQTYEQREYSGESDEARKRMLAMMNPA